MNYLDIYLEYTQTICKCKFCEKKGNIIELIREKNRKDLIQMVEVCKFLWEQMGS